MSIINPVINVKRPFFARLLGFQYKVYLEFAYEFYRGNTRSCENDVKFIKYFKNKEDAIAHIKYIKDRLTGATPRIDDSVGLNLELDLEKQKG